MPVVVWLVLVGLGIWACGDDQAASGKAPGIVDAGSDSADSSASGGADGGLDAVDGAASDAAAELEPGNALLLADGTITPLYRLKDTSASALAVGFTQTGTEVTALDEHGAMLWKKDLGEGQLFGGFDFDADGWPDLGLARSKDSGQICGGEVMLDTWLDVARGKNGELFPLVGPEPSLCWTFGTTTYPTPQWTVLDVLFGAGTSTLFVSPYATKGSYLAFGGAAFSTTGELWYPASASYDSTYVNDKPNAYGGPQSFTSSPHVANGLFLSHQGSERLLFFTSSRAVQYAVGPLAADQLITDTPFLPGNRTDLVGRNYGLVLPDPADPARVVLIAGTDTRTVFDDMTSATMTSDPWGQIERHVAIFDVAAGKIDDRFFSYAHDNSDANKYEGRVVYPPNPIVKSADGSASRLAFNVYEGGHWMLHITGPGVTSDAVVLKDMFLWDVFDLDRDGADEWILSPSRDPSDPDVPGYYYVKWRTVIAHFDAASLSLVDSVEHPGMIPFLVGRFREPARTTSRGALYPPSLVRTAKGLELYLRGSDGLLQTLVVAP